MSNVYVRAYLTVRLDELATVCVAALHQQLGSAFNKQEERQEGDEQNENEKKQRARQQTPGI